MPLLQVVEAARYEVVLMYTSRALASFELAVGPLAEIQQGTAPAITAQLPAMVSSAVLLQCAAGRNAFVSDACLLFLVRWRSIATCHAVMMCHAFEVHAVGFIIFSALSSFELAVGPLADIQQGTAPSITAQLPAMVRHALMLRAFSMVEFS